MPIDVASHLGAVRRSVKALERDGQPARAVILERSYDTDIDDLWDAVTSPQRLRRWFLPVEGELKRGGRTRFTLTHTAPLSDFWKQYGPGAVGVGWEGGLMGLALYIADPEGMKLDEATFSASPEGKRFHAGSSERWGEAAIEAGEDADLIAAAVRNTTAFYTGEPPAS